MKKHKRTCKSKQQNRCFAAAQDLFSDESDTGDEDGWLPYEELTATATPDDDTRNMFEQINECFRVA